VPVLVLHTGHAAGASTVENVWRAWHSVVARGPLRRLDRVCAV